MNECCWLKRREKYFDWRKWDSFHWKIGFFCTLILLLKYVYIFLMFDFFRSISTFFVYFFLQFGSFLLIWFPTFNLIPLFNQFSVNLVNYLSNKRKNSNKTIAELSRYRNTMIVIVKQNIVSSIILNALV